MSIMLMFVVFAVVFFAAYYGFLRLVPDKEQPGASGLPIYSFILFGFIGCLSSYFITPDQNDAIYPSSLWLPIAAFSSALGAFFLLRRYSSHKAAFAILFALCLLNTLLLPTDFSLCDHLIPLIAERLILALCWSSFAVLYFNMNTCDGTLSLESLSICIGLILMYIIGIQPQLYGCYACVFAALFLAFHFFSLYPAKLVLSISESRIVGFLLGWLCVLATVEGNGSCVVILIMYYIYEIILASFRRFFFNARSKCLSDNTFYSSLASIGVPAENINNLISRLNIMLILLAGFQIYAPNAYTVIIISFFMMFWLTDRVMTENGNHNILLTGMLWSILHKSKKTDKGN